MQGYIGPKEMTTAAMTSDGFMRTGDIGYIDRDGFVYLVDRAKEMMKVRGFVHTTIHAGFHTDDELLLGTKSPQPSSRPYCSHIHW